ncbi:beta-2-microglobulin-like [Thunnus thynnus]|uniref:beta-2-microglobulin-like n=1 Tax=Thunnus thynnus TaxID=8237 RepID=UPI003528348F
MNKFVFAALVGLFCLLGPSVAKESSPKVQVYSRLPGEFGKSNTLICHVSGFHPPEIKIELLRNGIEIPNSDQTDLAFEENWHYHLTKSVTFTPQKEDHFACRVTHMNKEPKLYIWDPDM